MSHAHLYALSGLTFVALPSVLSQVLRIFHCQRGKNEQKALQQKWGKNKQRKLVVQKIQFKRIPAFCIAQFKKKWRGGVLMQITFNLGCNFSEVI